MGGSVARLTLLDWHVVPQARHVATYDEPSQLVGLAVRVDAGVPDIQNRHV